MDKLIYINQDLTDFGSIKVLDMTTRLNWPELEINLKV